MVPKITDEQRRASLEKAKAVRKARAEIREWVSEGRIGASAVIDMADEGNEAAAGMRVRSLVKAHPGYGDAKTDKLLEELGIPEGRRVRGLGRLQREALASALRA